MRKLILGLMLCMGWCCSTLWAQTPVEDLQNGVEIYNAMRTYSDGIAAKDFTDENLNDIKMRLDKGVSLMDKVIREGNADQIKTARYFRVNFYNQYAFSCGKRGQAQKAYDTYKTIESQMTAFTPADFPLKYVFFEKNFAIKWENFGSTQAEYYISFGETAFMLGKYEDCVNNTRKGLAHSDATPWLLYIGTHKLLDVGPKQAGLISETEKVELAEKSIRLYDGLDESYQKAIADNNYPVVKRGMGILLADAQAKNNQESARRCVGVLPILAKLEPASQSVLQLYEICFRQGVAPDAAFAENAEQYARNMQSTDALRASYVGVAAVDRQAQSKAATDCSGLQDIAARYRFWKQEAKAVQYTKSAENCMEEQKKAAKRAQKIAKRSNSHFNLYAGAYLFPLLNSNAKRDYGGVVNFVFKRQALEFSYLRINRNKENIFDLWVNEVDGADQDNLSRWDGFYAHFQPKFLGSRGSYWGLLLGYATKQFDPMTVNVQNDLDGSYSSAAFEPSVKQYITMFNMGALALSKGVGADMYFGIGAHYSQFDAGTSIDRTAYTIDNPLLENRKDNYFGLIMRFGITVGLNAGRGIRRH